MAGLKYFERTKLILELIEKERTGSPKDLAIRFHVSERTIYRIIEELSIHTSKKIEYSDIKKSYISREF